MRWRGQLQLKNVKPLGRGGHGKVFAATREGAGGTSEPVVLKLPHGEAPTELAQSRRFLLEEARLVAKLRHPNIIGFRDYNDVEVDGELTSCLILEDGGIALNELLRVNGGRMEPGLAAFIAIGILGGLAHAHAHDTVHRDVKPSNVVIGVHGQVRLIDFGIAKAEDSENTTTVVGILKGTPLYVSPEAFVGRKLDGRADLWSVGILLYEMLVGRYPWHISRAECANNLMYASRVAKAVQDFPLPDLPPELVPASLAEVVRTLTNKSREDRYDDAMAAINALERTMTSLIGPLAACRELGQQVTAAISQLANSSGGAREEAGADAPTFDIKSRAQQEEFVHVVVPPHTSGGIEMPSGLFDSVVTRASSGADQDDVTEQLPLAVRAKRRSSLVAVAALASAVLGLGVATGLYKNTSSAETRSMNPNAGDGGGGAPRAAMLVPEAPSPRGVVSKGLEGPAPLAHVEAAGSAGVVGGQDPPKDRAAGAGSGGLDESSTRERQPIAVDASEAPIESKTRGDSGGSAVRVGVLEVIVVPRGAFVSLDGREPVRAPAKFDGINVGVHVVRIGLQAGELSEERRVRLRAGQTQRLEVELANPF